MNVAPSANFLLNEIQGLKPENIVKTEGKWVHLNCPWKRIATEGDKNIKYDDRKIGYVAISCYLNINAETLKVYNNDDHVDLALKFSALTFGTSVFLIAKTIYHLLFPISLSYQICKTVYEARKEALKNENAPEIDLTSRIIKIIAKNCIDIIRTPLYMIAMTITALLAVISAPFKHSLLYHGRVFYGELLMSLNWGEKTTIWTFAPCMQPLADLKNQNEQKMVYEEKDTLYDNVPRTKMHALNNLARNINNLLGGTDLCPCIQ